MKPFQAAWKGLQVERGVSLTANYVSCLEAFRPLQQVKLNGLALVECSIAIFLYRGEVDENIFASGPLNESVAFRPVEPLYCTLLSH